MSKISFDEKEASLIELCLLDLGLSKDLIRLVKKYSRQRYANLWETPEAISKFLDIRLPTPLLVDKNDL